MDVEVTKLKDGEKKQVEKIRNFAQKLEQILIIENEKIILQNYDWMNTHLRQPLNEQKKLINKL